MINLDNKVGRFSISADLINQSPDIIMMVMGRCIITRAEYIIIYDYIDYDAFSPDFDEVEEGAITPKYTIAITHDEDGTIDKISFIKSDK